MTEKIKEVVEELETWWASFSEPTRNLFRTVVASLPGGEKLADTEFGCYYYAAIPIPALGWTEAELLARLLSSLRDAGDVQAVAQAILAWDGLDDEEE